MTTSLPPCCIESLAIVFVADGFRVPERGERQTCLTCGRVLELREHWTVVGEPLPDGVERRAATIDEQRAALVTFARERVAEGAGHDCAEWIDAAGRCALCDRLWGRPTEWRRTT